MKKMFVSVFVLMFIVLILGCGKSTVAQNHVFGNMGLTGVVVGNTVKYFEHGRNGWTENPEYEFTIP
jgi:uncharacterized lipoprotein YehR (DUF1307 family)